MAAGGFRHRGSRSNSAQQADDAAAERPGRATQASIADTTADAATSDHATAGTSDAALAIEHWFVTHPGASCDATGAFVIASVPALDHRALDHLHATPGITLPCEGYQPPATPLGVQYLATVAAWASDAAILRRCAGLAASAKGLDPTEAEQLVAALTSRRSGDPAVAHALQVLQASLATAPPSDPVERASFDYRRKLSDGSWALRGQPDTILHYLAINVGASLYQGQLAMLVMNDHEHAAALAKLDQQNDPAWASARQAAHSLQLADTQFASSPSTEARYVLASRNRGDVVYEAELARRLDLAGSLDAWVKRVFEYGDGQTAGILLSSAVAGGALSVAELDARSRSWPMYTPPDTESHAAPQSGSQLAVSAATGAIHSAQHDFQQARNAISALDMKLAMQLRDLHPALTSDEMKLYIDQYRAGPEYQAALALQHTEGARLAAAMSTYAPQLDQFAHEDPHAGATPEALFDDYMVLATTDAVGASKAAAWASSKCTIDGTVTAVNDPLYKDLRGNGVTAFDSLLATVANTTSNDVVGKVLALLKDDGEKTSWWQRFREAWESIEESYVSVFESSHYAYSAKQLPAKMAQWMQTMTKLAPDPTKPNRKAILAAIGEIKREAKTLDPLSRKVMGSSLDVFSMFTELADGATGKLDPVMKNAAEVVEKLRELLGFIQGKPQNEAQERLRELRRLNGEILDRLVRVLGVLDFAAGAYATLQDLQHMRKDFDPFQIAAFLGDACATIGGAFELAPPPWDVVLLPFGKMLNIAGQAVAGAANLLEHFFVHHEDPTVTQKRDILNAIIDPNASAAQRASTQQRNDAIAQNEAAENLALAADHGLQRSDIDALAASSSYLFTIDHAMRGLVNVQGFLQGGFQPNPTLAGAGVRYTLPPRSFSGFLHETIAKAGNDRLHTAVELSLRYAGAPPVGAPRDASVALFLGDESSPGEWSGGILASEMRRS
jgi:hypothetical protein